MKLIFAGDPVAVAITDYRLFIYNCNLGRCKMPYRVPVPSLDALQFYNYFGVLKPVTVEIQLISTCGDSSVVNLSTEKYIIGQLPDLRYYGVFKNLVASPEPPLPGCFVVSFVFGFVDGSERRYFSEEICIENCLDLMEIKSCYPDSLTTLAFDCTNIYFGFHAGDPGEALGSLSIRYVHRIFVRLGIVLNTSHKLTFKTYLVRNFRTEQQKIWELRCELLPEWYKEYFAAVVARGVITVRETVTSDLVTYVLNESLFELAEEDFKLWKPTVSLIETCREYFGCDEGNCIAPCLQPPDTIEMEEHVEGDLYTFDLSGGQFLTGEKIFWYVTKKDTGAAVASGVIVAPAGLQFTIDNSVTPFDPAEHCYTFKWRKSCNDSIGDPGSYSDDFTDDYLTATDDFSAYIIKDIGKCDGGGGDGGGGEVCKTYSFEVAGSPGDAWHYDAVLCDGSGEAKDGIVSDGPPANICAKEGTVNITGAITKTEGDICGGDVDVDITQYTVNEGFVEGVCEMTVQVVRTPAATAASVTNGHRIKVTVHFVGDNSYSIDYDFIFEIGDAFSNTLVAHVHAGSSDYCSVINTSITAIAII